jgi:two-component system, cell cycle sensor histidine kinase and response regulator CckA
MKPTKSRHQETPSGRLSTSVHAVGSVLVMDDDEAIRVLAVFILEHLGYTVTTCVNGEEAIELYRNAKESGTPYLTGIIDLMILGGMGGKDAAKHILRIDPVARLIVSSGNSADPIMAHYESYGFHASLPKPYKISDLAKLLASFHSL